MSLNETTIKRLAKDVKYLLKNPLNYENIYYKHDENNILKGYALIIGHESTPYEFGFYFFQFDFPENYPFSPPIVTYLTNDGKMRYNPNLYINGKVCLSILNTWSGEGWTSCQSIYSVLLTLSTVLNTNPLLNEPGIRENNHNIYNYNLLLSYKNIEFAIFKQLEYLKKNYTDNSINTNINSSTSLIKKYNNVEINYFYTIKLFEDIMIENINKNYNYIKNNLEILYSKMEHIKQLYIGVYNIQEKVDIKKLKKNFSLFKIDK
jgi:ubiquitin-protein ligase